MKQLLSLSFLLFAVLGFSQNQLNPVTWSVTYVDKANNEGEIIYKATIDKKWHIYSQRETDAGPIPTSFSITANPNFVVVGKVLETNAHEEFVKAFDAKVFVFEKEAIFTQKIKRINKKAFDIKTSVEFMTCNDMQCLPPKTIELVVAVPSFATKK